MASSALAWAMASIRPRRSTRGDVDIRAFIVGLKVPALQRGHKHRLRPFTKKLPGGERYLPMQKLEKITPSRSSEENSPVIAPKAFWASRNSSASKSRAGEGMSNWAARLLQMGVHLRQRLHVARARDVDPLRRRLPASDFQKYAPQGFQAIARTRRNSNRTSIHSPRASRIRHSGTGAISLVPHIDHRDGSGNLLLHGSRHGRICSQIVRLVHARQVVQEENGVGPLNL